MHVQLQEKQGSGIGAQITFTNESGEYVGSLTFHEGGDWQVTDSSHANEFSHDLFEDALSLARNKYPSG